MKLARYAIFAALCAGLSACTSVTTDTAQTWPASPDYTAHGTLLGVKAYDYGKVTVVELPENGSVVVKDAQGRKVKTERVGQFVRFPSMSHFVVESGGEAPHLRPPFALSFLQLHKAQSAKPRRSQRNPVMMM